LVGVDQQEYDERACLGRCELKNADGSNGVRLCYIDAPFATRQEFQAARGRRDVAYARVRRGTRNRSRAQSVGG
jgi:hypothetical protein